MSIKAAVYYKDFGAVGDGVTDDFAAMKAAHEYANEHHLPVFADSGKTYYIGNNGTDFIPVKTSTNWGDATIIIDDRDIAPSDPARNASIFKIISDNKTVTHGADSELVKALNAAGGIKTTDTKLPYAPGHTVMLIPYNSERKVYIRYGGNANNGQDQHEVMIIDGEGNIDKDTPALLDYDKITSVLELRIDDEPITLEGGLFHTRANQAPKAYTYYSRNMYILRSNVTVRCMKRLITDENDSGAPYAAFFAAHSLNNLLVEDCTFQAHRWYYNEDPKTGGPTGMGTYEISAGNANNIYYKNCNQTNYYDPNTGKPTSAFFGPDGKKAGEGTWGVMGSNYCKNITYDGCKLNRYDAHAGVYNATLVNSEVIHICLIGGGTARIENCIVHCSTLIILRGDYGSFWDGDIIIKNTKFVSDSERPHLINGSWYNHDFGYKTSLPNIYIDGLTVEHNAEELTVFADYTYDRNIGDFTGATVVIDGEEVENKNPMSLPEIVSVKNSPDLKLAPAFKGSWMRDAIKITC